MLRVFGTNVPEDDLAGFGEFLPFQALEIQSLRQKQLLASSQTSMTAPERLLCLACWADRAFHIK